MRTKENKANLLMSYVEGLPFFDFKSLSTVEKNRHYLKIFISRYKKKGIILGLKKGLYTTSKFSQDYKNKEFFDRKSTPFTEFIANIIYQPSYLSLEYVLAENGILTDAPFAFTSITKKKKNTFQNIFGRFTYHNIKDDLFFGFETKIKYDNNIATIMINKASKAKALFDFLYLRKTKITDQKFIEELRLNLDSLAKSDIKEFRSYIKLEGSRKMKDIYNYLFEPDDGD